MESCSSDCSDVIAITRRCRTTQLLTEIRASKAALSILIIVGLIQIVFEIALGGFASFPDTEEYIETVNWYKDGSGDEYPLRIQRPLQIAAALALEPLLGVTNSFVLINSILYISSVLFFYLFSKRILGNDRDAMVSALLFELSFCVVYWGLALLTDMLVWCVMCVSFYLLSRIQSSWNSKDIYALAIVVGIGMLNKESVAAAGLILIVMLAWKGYHRLNGRLRAMLEIIPPVLLMGAPFLAVQLAIMIYFGPGYSFFDYHLFHNTSDLRGAMWYLPVTFVIAFNILLVLYALGIREFLRKNAMFTRARYLVYLAIVLLPVVAFEQYSPRLSYLVFPFVIPVAAVGLRKLPKVGANDDWALAIVVALGILANFAALFGDQLRDILGIWSR
ncbi:MAG TPA: glycosyltransferase family 39 protein [Thermoplasmata archaeon]